MKKTQFHPQFLLGALFYANNKNIYKVSIFFIFLWHINREAVKKNWFYANCSNIYHLKNI
jgi:hypothetical protein